MTNKDTDRESQNKKTKPVDDLIEVANIEKGSAIAAGRGARALVVNFFGGYGYFLAITILIIAILSGYFLWQSFFPEKMTGDFRVAVADFEVIGNSDQEHLGSELAEGVYLKLNESLSEIDKDFTTVIWSPEKVGKVKGETPEERAKSAEEITKKIGADILVYGVIDMSNSVWEITPEFYIASENFYEAEEITGQYQLGETFPLVGQENIARRIELSNKYKTRVQAISKITIGLAYFSLRDYENALETFQSAENIPEWNQSQGKEVLYLLAGNAAMKAKYFDTAINNLNKSLSIDSDYGRPLITLGSVYYLQALIPFEESTDPADIDLDLLQKAIESYTQALEAKNQPALSDITTKVDFGLGQCYLMQAYAGMDVSLELAVYHFQKVVDAYGNGENPRIREITAESHARLGLINNLSGYTEDAIKEYERAAELLFDNPERQNQYQERVQELSRE